MPRYNLLVEFGNEYISMAQVVNNELVAFQKTSAPVFEGMITDSDQTALIVRDYLRKNNINRCDVKIILQHPRSGIRFKSFPEMKAADLKKAIKNCVKDLFPATDETYVYDYRTTVSDNGMVNAIIARLPEKVSASYAGFFRDLGLKPVLMDLYANSASMYLEQKFKGVYAAIFENQSSIFVLGFEAGTPVASRDIVFGGSGLADNALRDIEFAVYETKKYLLTMNGLDRIFKFTRLGIIDKPSIAGLYMVEDEQAVMRGAL